jgi:carbon monoxide dehydrogenase subunit G
VITVERSIHINKPAAEVFAFLTDFANDAKWQSDLIRSEKTSAGPLGVGTTAVFVQKFMGREMKNDAVVTVYEPPKKYGQKTTSGPVQFEFNATFEEMGGGTHLTMKFTGEPGGFFKVAGGLIKGELEKTLDRDFAKLKQLLEG